MTLFLIPARAGSKRLPGKNKRLFCGAPLYRWSVMTALRIGGEGAAIIVSTDDQSLLASDVNAFERPAALCGDDSPTGALVSHVWDYHQNCDSICLLQPTSPTRPDSLVRQLIAHGGQVRSVTNGVPNGQCYVYRKGHEGWIDIETERGHDIDTLEQFQAAEQDMMRRFA
jgi:CMP-N-acetylneuraminic acid synthetase